MPTQEPLPLLPSNSDVHMPPANFRGHLSKSSHEPTLSSCSGQLPYPRTASEDGAPREAPAWSQSPSLRRSPRAERLSSVPAVPSTAPPPQQGIHFSPQYILPVTEGGHDPFGSDAGPLGDGSYREKSPLTFSGSCLFLPPYPAPQGRGGPSAMASGAQPQRRLSLPPRGSEGDSAGGGHQGCLSCCNNDMVFNLYPLRWLGSNVPARPSSGNGSDSPPLWQHRYESATTTGLTLASLAGQKELSYLKACLCSFLFKSYFPLLFHRSNKSYQLFLQIASLPFLFGSISAFLNTQPVQPCGTVGRCRWMISRTTAVMCKLLHFSSFFRQSLFRPQSLHCASLAQVLYRAGCRTSHGMSWEWSRWGESSSSTCGHISFDAAQDTFGFLSCICTLPDRVQYTNCPRSLSAGLDPVPYMYIFKVPCCFFQALFFSFIADYKESISIHSIHHPLCWALP